jgi:hypothetical protein
MRGLRFFALLKCVQSSVRLDFVARAVTHTIRSVFFIALLITVFMYVMAVVAVYSFPSPDWNSLPAAFASLWVYLTVSPLAGTFNCAGERMDGH